MHISIANCGKQHITHMATLSLTILLFFSCTKMYTTTALLNPGQYPLNGPIGHVTRAALGMKGNTSRCCLPCNLLLMETAWTFFIHNTLRYIQSECTFIRCLIPFYSDINIYCVSSPLFKVGCLQLISLINPLQNHLMHII